MTEDPIYEMAVEEATALCAERDREALSAGGVLQKSMVGFHPIAKPSLPSQDE